MYTKKRKINVPKKVFLSGPILVQYKDPERSTISYTIGQTKISQALLDLGESINLLPLLEY